MHQKCVHGIQGSTRLRQCFCDPGPSAGLLSRGRRSGVKARSSSLQPSGGSAGPQLGKTLRERGSWRPGPECTSMKHGWCPPGVPPRRGDRTSTPLPVRLGHELPRGSPPPLPCPAGYPELTWRLGVPLPLPRSGPGEARGGSAGGPGLGSWPEGAATGEPPGVEHSGTLSGRDPGPLCSP